MGISDIVSAPELFEPAVGKRLEYQPNCPSEDEANTSSCRKARASACRCSTAHCLAHSRKTHGRQCRRPARFRRPCRGCSRVLCRRRLECRWLVCRRRRLRATAPRGTLWTPPQYGYPGPRGLSSLGRKTYPKTPTQTSNSFALLMARDVGVVVPSQEPIVFFIGFHGIFRALRRPGTAGQIVVIFCHSRM